MDKKKQFAVLGLGRFGQSAAATLEKMGYEVLGVDMDEHVVRNMAGVLSHVVSFDIRDANALDQIGIANFDTVIITSKNLEASLMATMLCSERNVGEIVVKAIDERHAEMSKRLGATKIVFSERDMARRTAMQLASLKVTDYMDIDASIQILAFDVPPKLMGQNLLESNLRSEYNVNVVAIISNGETMITPPPKYVFSGGDKVYIIGSYEALSRFEQEVIED
ncbi:MAG TPA: hypothetical protein DEP57_07780 [Selenomonas sp.]|nr:TrkA family potassium uptake protein [Selenomonadaceae bacterium]HCB93694.1 hypothetical protein [Selenomonas sp.]